MEEKKCCKMCKGKCSSYTCSDCDYYNHIYDNGKNWCGYHQDWESTDDKPACSNFRRR